MINGMKKTKYTDGFEIFWDGWRHITGKEGDRPEAFAYWKRDSLEGDEGELLRILQLQQDERQRNKRKGQWIPEWCFCRKWLNKRRYEYIPEPPKKRQKPNCIMCGKPADMLVGNDPICSRECYHKALLGAEPNERLGNELNALMRKYKENK
jgi:hypothetical protein